MVPEALAVMSWRGPPCRVNTHEALSFGAQDMERARLMKVIQGAWMNMDCPSERYLVVGHHVIRNDLQGCRRFSLHWDPGRRQLQWGTQSRLYLACLGEGMVAWVPLRNTSRAWRWQRAAPMAMSPRVVSAWSGPSMRSHHLVQADSFSGYGPWRRPYSMRRWDCDGPGWFGGWGFSPRRNRSYSRNFGRNSGFQDHGSRLACGLSSAEVSDLLFRDITPEDYEILLRLDDTVSRPTASASSIDSLEKASGKDLLGESCSVCLMLFEESDVAAVLPCRHSFHSICISKWLAECRSSCPLCGETLQTMDKEQKDPVNLAKSLTNQTDQMDPAEGEADEADEAGSSSSSAHL